MAPWQATARASRPSSPTRPAGNHEAYAVTSNGVYHIADTRPGSGATWTDLTSNIFQITHEIFGNSAYIDQIMGNIQALAVDWRYVIPNDPDSPPTDNPTDPNRTHPVLYVAGEGGVLVSYDDGGSWQRFPSALPSGPNNTPTPPGDGGGFPTANVTDLDLALGNIQRTTGRPDLAGPYDPVNPGDADPDTLLATTFGRGQYAIRLAPVTFPNTVRLNPNSVAGTADDGTPLVSTSQPVFEGLSSITGFNNATRITIADVTDPQNRKVIGGFDPADLRDQRRGQLDGCLRCVLDPDQARCIQHRGPEDDRDLCDRRCRGHRQ